MPLSEAERRQLEALERSLAVEDPALVRTFQQRRSPRPSGASILAVFLVGAAFAVVMVGVITGLLLVGVVGFVLMIVAGTKVRAPHQQTQPSTRRNYTRKDVV